MDAFVARWRWRIATHGALIFLIGIILGFPLRNIQDSYGMRGPLPSHLHSASAELPGTPSNSTIASDCPECMTVHRISSAHHHALQHGFLLFAMSAAIAYFRLGRRLLAGSGWMLILGAWLAVIGNMITAFKGVDGRELTGEFWNDLAWGVIGFGVVAMAACFAIISVRSIWGIVRDFLTRPTWRNWAGLVKARPRRRVTPRTAGQLEQAINDAVRARLPIRAFGGKYSWNAMAKSDGMMINMKRLKEAEFHRAPDVGGTASVTAQAGMTLLELTRFLNREEHELVSAPVFPWVQVGGAFATGCHGTGTKHAHFTELVSKIELYRVEGGAAVFETRSRPESGASQDVRDEWNALLVNLGAFGIILNVTFDCVPRKKYRLLDQKKEMHEVMDDELDEILIDNEYVELFWFPYTEKVWVRSWNEADPQDPYKGWPPGYWTTQWLRNKVFGPPFMYLLALVPFLTPFVMKMYAKWHGTHDRVLYRHEANHYQRYAVRAVDMGYAIPYDPTHTDALKRYDRLKRAWYSVVDSLEELKHTEQIYPQNLVMHARFVRGDSAALIAPSTENAHTMYIELLSFVGTPRYEEFFNLIERGWLRLGGRPHWAKLSFNVEKIRDAYPKEKMEKWLEIREKWDPDGIFLNDHLREVMKL